MEPELHETWKAVCNHIKDVQNIDAKQVDAFFARLHPEAISNGYLMLTAENAFIKKWIERNYMPAIKQALMAVHGTEYIVEIEVDEDSFSPSPTITVNYVAPEPSPAQPAGTASPAMNGSYQPPQGMQAPNPPAAHQEHTGIPGMLMHNEPGQTMAPQAAPVQVMPQHQQPQPSAEESGSDQAQQGSHPAAEGLASKLTFENYVIGDSNRLAYSMAVAVAEAPGKPNLNPLFIYGKSGLGKTHLLRAIQNYVLETRPGAKVVYTDSAEFLSEYASASAEHDKNKTSFQNFQNRYANADILLIDDVQYFTGKSATLDMVFQLFNKFTTQGKQVVLSADRAPKNIDIDERYKSRFNQGGTFDIQPPEIETKLAIVKSFIEEYKRSENAYDLYIPEDIQLHIAEISSSNIRELKSAITKVIYQIRYFNNPNITLADVRALLENHFSSGISKRLTVELIQKEVENYFKISHSDLVGTKRSRNIMLARQVAIYLCRNMLDIPYNDIGKKFNRDHSTMMYSVGQVEERLKTDRDLQEEIEIITKIIRES